MELNAFQNEFRELANKFKENEKIIQKLGVRGTALPEINEELTKPIDNLDVARNELDNVRVSFSS